jgi:hypothetical protein
MFGQIDGFERAKHAIFINRFDALLHREPS